MHFLNCHVLTTFHNFSSENSNIFWCQSHYWKQCKVRCQHSPWENLLIVNISCSKFLFSSVGFHLLGSGFFFGGGVGGVWWFVWWYFFLIIKYKQLFPLSHLHPVLSLFCIGTSCSLSGIDSIALLKPYVADLIYSLYLEGKQCKLVILSKKELRLVQAQPIISKFILHFASLWKVEGRNMSLSLVCYWGQATSQDHRLWQLSRLTGDHNLCKTNMVLRDLCAVREPFSWLPTQEHHTQ